MWHIQISPRNFPPDIWISHVRHLSHVIHLWHACDVTYKSVMSHTCDARYMHMSHCSELQWVAVSCSELQWVAVSCSESLSHVIHTCIIWSHVIHIYINHFTHRAKRHATNTAVIHMTHMIHMCMIWLHMYIYIFKESWHTHESVPWHIKTSRYAK